MERAFGANVDFVRDINPSMEAQQLEHVDATLAIFGEADADRIKSVKLHMRVPLFKQRKLAQLVQDALRKAGKPLALSQISGEHRCRARYGEEAIPAMRHRVSAPLQQSIP